MYFIFIIQDNNDNEILYLLNKYIKIINGSDKLKGKCEEFISTIKNNDSYLVLLDGVKEVFNLYYRIII